jgi:AcrR family transcriptional regulator
MQTTKEKILDAVISYIKQPLDLNQVSISDIAKKAEIGKSTIYEYFDNKSALIEETYLHLLKNYEKTLMQDIASLEFESALKKQLTWILNVIEDAKNIMEVIMRGQIDIGFVKLNACSKKIEQVQRNMENRFI